MELPRSVAKDRWRIILPRRKGSELLVLPEGPRECLPNLEIPSNTRLAEQLNETIKRTWGLETISLFAPNVSFLPAPIPDIRYHVVELTRPNDPLPPGLQWVPFSSLSGTSFEDSRDFLVAQRVLQEFQQTTHGAQDQPFARPGWFRDLLLWTVDAITPWNLQVTGRFQQFTATPTFSLIRFETNGPAVWFKAVGPPNEREFLVTTTLAEIVPCRIPQLIARRPEWNGWLSLEAAGTPLGDVDEFGPWKRATLALAALQIESVDHIPRLLRAGSRDARSATLMGALDAFIDRMTEMMRLQTKSSPAPLTGPELLQLKRDMNIALVRFQELGLPDTLGHFDFNPTNVIVSKDDCVFLDWAEAYVGCPFFTFEYLSQFLRNASPKVTDEDRELVRAYGLAWQSLLSPSVVHEALLLSPLLAVFAYAVCSDTWTDAQRIQDPQVQAYLRTLTRRMNIEAKKAVPRCLPC